MESMYFGNATLSSFQSNAGEIINDGKNGFLFDSDTNFELSQKIKYIFKRKDNLMNIKVEAEKDSKKYLLESVNYQFYKHLFNN